MSDRIRCACRRCTIRGLTGPAVIITVGVLFLFDQMRGGNFSFGDTYPVILIVIGVISLAAAAAPTDGHVSGRVPSAAPGAPGAGPTAPQNQIPVKDKGDRALWRIFVCAAAHSFPAFSCFSLDCCCSFTT